MFYGLIYNNIKEVLLMEQQSQQSYQSTDPCVNACLTILNNTLNADIRKEGTDFFFNFHTGMIKTQNFRAIYKDLCPSSQRLIKLAYHLFNGECFLSKKDNDFSLAELTFGLDRNNCKLVAQAICIYLEFPYSEVK